MNQSYLLELLWFKSKHTVGGKQGVSFGCSLQEYLITETLLTCLKIRFEHQNWKHLRSEIWTKWECKAKTALLIVISASVGLTTKVYLHILGDRSNWRTCSQLTRGINSEAEKNRHFWVCRFSIFYWMHLCIIMTNSSLKMRHWASVFKTAGLQTFCSSNILDKNPM